MFNVKCLMYLSFLLVNVQRGAVGEGYAVGAVEGLQVYLVVADARAYSYDSTQEFTMLARIETGQRQLVPAFQLAQVAHLPDKIICGLTAKP